jgi:hypothetical protein
MKFALIQLRQSFREFYGNLSIEELATNKNLSVSIERIETLFRKILP